MRRQKVHETKTDVFLVWCPWCFPRLCERLQDVPLPLPLQASWATWVNVLALLCTPLLLERCRRKRKERWAWLDQETKLSGQTMENGSCEKKINAPVFSLVFVRGAWITARNLVHRWGPKSEGSVRIWTQEAMKFVQIRSKVSGVIDITACLIWREVNAKEANALTVDEFGQCKSKCEQKQKVVGVMRCTGSNLASFQMLRISR